MKDRSSIDASYDAVADVLYLRAAEFRYTKNTEDVAGLVLRYDLETREPVGATVIDYKEYWSSRKSVLAGRLAKFFHISASEAERVLERAR